jgi:hypothetical protein
LAKDRTVQALSFIAFFPLFAELDEQRWARNFTNGSSSHFIVSSFGHRSVAAELERPANLKERCGAIGEGSID